MGHMVFSNLKPAGSIFGCEKIVVIDGGSTNNFIQTHLVSHLHLVIQFSPYLKVTVGNGKSVSCGNVSLQVPLKLSKAQFSVDLLLLPLTVLI